MGLHGGGIHKSCIPQWRARCILLGQYYRKAQGNMVKPRLRDVTTVRRKFR